MNTRIITWIMWTLLATPFWSNAQQPGQTVTAQPLPAVIWTPGEIKFKQAYPMGINIVVYALSH